MNISALFIQRPIATTLLTVALALVGLVAYRFLPVAPLPQVEFPTIQVQAQLPGASPEIMASAVATPLERQFGRIAGLNEMTSTSYLGSTNISLLCWVSSTKVIFIRSPSSPPCRQPASGRSWRYSA
jgi:multidrug efflux pump subunit AcrB